MLRRPSSIASLALLPLFVGLAACSSAGSSASEDDGSPTGSYVDVGQALSSSTDPNHLVDVPFYFGVPKDAVEVTLNRDGYSYPTLWNTSKEVANSGLRIIAVSQAGSSIAQKKAARHDMAQQLAKAGVLQEGDIALTFRPELAGDLAYTNIQMGITHTALVWLQNGVAHNVDSPLDTDYLGEFDASHYVGNGTTDLGTDALHIIRPRLMNDARKAQLHSWITTLNAALPRFHDARQQVMFQSDYLTPIYAAKHMTTQQTVTTLGKILLEQDTTTKLPMYCSEFVWHMIALSGCTADEIKTAPAEGAACVDPAYPAMPLVDPNGIGLSEGPLTNLLLADPSAQAGLINQVFTTSTNTANLSSGHIQVAMETAPLMAGMKQYYTAKVGGTPLDQLVQGATQLNSKVPNNYSPTAFLTNTMGPTASRPVDYVATIIFTDPAGYTKAQQLAKISPP